MKRNEKAILFFYLINIFKYFCFKNLHIEHTQHPDLHFQIPFPSRKNQGSLEKWLSLGLEGDILSKSGVIFRARKYGSAQKTKQNKRMY